MGLRRDGMRWAQAALVALGAALAAAPAVTLVPGAAVAAPGDPAARAVRVQRYVDIATEHFKAKDFEAALIALRGAEPLAEGLPAQAVIRYNIARVFEEMGKADAAAAAYDRYLKTSDTGDRRRKAREALTRLAGQRSGGLEIDCGGVAGTVIVDGFPEGDCPWHWDTVKPGTYAVRVLAEGYLPVSREVAVQPGQTARMLLTMRPRRAAPQRARSGPGPWPWVAAGGAVVAVGAGLGMHLLALDASDTVDGLDPGRARDEAQSTYETRRTLAIVGYSVGAAALGTMIYLLVADGGSPSARVVPTPGGVLVRF